MADRILIVDDEPNLRRRSRRCSARGIRGAHRDVGTRRARSSAPRRARSGHPRSRTARPRRRRGLQPDSREPQHADRRVVGARAENDKVRALDAGADDYVTNRSGAEELLGAGSRGAAADRHGVSRTSRSCAARSYRPRAIPCSHRRQGDRLTPKEFELLTYLAQRPGRVVTHRAILRAIWGPQALDQPEHLRVLVGSLRRKDRAQSVPRRSTSSQSRGLAIDSWTPDAFRQRP